MQGLRALVTGGSRGIGRAIVEALVSEGCDVYYTHTGATDAEVNIPKATGVSVNFLDSSSLDQFISQTLSDLQFDILVNNAGIHIPENIYDFSEESWRSIMTVNLDAAASITKSISKGMVKQAKGWILNVSSVASIVSSPSSAAYSSSKAGLLGLTRAAAIDLGAHGILVNCLSPGTTQTDMVDRLLDESKREKFLERVPLGRFAEPSEIANVALFLVSNENSYITGQNIVVDGATTIR